MTWEWIAAGVVVAVALLLVAAARRDLPAAEVRALYAGPASRFVHLDGMDVHFRDEGDGPVLLLIHGTASSLHTWDGWARELMRDFRVVRYDLAGFGVTGPHPRRDYSIGAYVATAVSFLGALGIARANVAGNSLGGRIAWELALRHPDRVERLVLVDALARRPDPIPRPIRMARMPGARLLFRAFTPRSLVAQSVRDVYGDARRIAPGLIDRYRTLLLRAGNRQAYVDRARTDDDDAVVERMREIGIPVLVQWGGRDRWIPLPHGRDMVARMRGAVLRVYADAGHVPMEEIPERTARDARAFLLGQSLDPGDP